MLFGFSAGFIIVLLTTVVWVGYTISENEMASSTSRYQQALLNQINKQLSLLMDGIEQQSLTAARNIASQYPNLGGTEYDRFQRMEKFEEYLAQLTYSSPAIESIEFYFSSEENVRSTKVSSVHFFGPSVLHRQSWAKQLELADSVWIASHKIATWRGDKEVVSFARKVYSNSGNYVGLLVFHAKTPVIEAIMKSGQELADASRVVLDGGGRKKIAVGDELSPAQISTILESIKGTNGFARAEYTGVNGREEYFVVWSQTLGSGWLLIEATPWSRITAGSVQLAKTLLAIGAAAIMLSVIFTLLFSKHFTRPVSDLLTAMNAFSVGKPPIHLPDDYRNEFGALFNGFRRLTERISELYESLKEEYRQKREAEISALQANINPHFLYNTLDQLNWMAVDAGQERISRILELVGRMLRLGLSNGERFITLKNEAEYLKCYLEIQRIRWGEGLTYEMDIPDAAGTLYVPKLTLQPFVENSIIHGFHGLQRGAIRVEAQADDGNLLIRITDDGNGITEDWRSSRRKDTGGYGIRNVEERLSVYFGNTSSVTIRSRDGGGTEVVILMPSVTEKPE